MKKICIIFLLIFITTGCKNNSLNCNLNGDKFKIVLDKGKIIEYYDSKGNMVDNLVIDEMNTYLKDSDTNQESKKILKDLLTSYGGSCESVNNSM